MASFDFITMAEFRDSLETDYREIKQAFEVESWKVVHVLSGSIIEAILVDHLIATNYQEETRRDPLTLGFRELLSACKAKGYITDNAFTLSTVISSYRNLIHPGRMKRLSQSIDRNTAQVAMALVEIIVDEIDRDRRESFGLTAEQLVKKMETDSSAPSILKHLLESMHDSERNGCC